MRIDVVRVGYHRGINVDLMTFASRSCWVPEIYVGNYTLSYDLWPHLADCKNALVLEVSSGGG